MRIKKSYYKAISVLVAISVLSVQIMAPLSVYAAPDRPGTPDSPETTEHKATPTPAPTAAPESTPAPTAAPVETTNELTPAPTETTTETTTTASTSSPQPSPAGTTQDGQMGDVDLATGDADGSGTIINTGNTNINADDGGDEGDSVSIVNADNGADSSNTGSATIGDNSTTTQINNADIDNDLEINTTTGENSASKNTGGNVAVKTGDATSTGTIVNSVNTNVDGVMVSEFNITDDHVGDFLLDFAANCVTGCGDGEILLANAGNGTESTNTADLEIIESDVTFQQNTADIENGLVLTANTGDNTADKNTGGDTTIETGDANLAGNIMNFVNNNFAGDVLLGVVNIFGDLIGDIVIPEEYREYVQNLALSNTGNGTDSTNTATGIINEYDTTVQFNHADIVNNIDIQANTGGNETSKNTDGNNGIETGDIDADVQVLNIANNNIYGGNWWFVLVNESGNWVGKIIGLPGATIDGNYAASMGTGVSESESGTINASNTGNGSDSENTAALNQTSETSTTQINDAKIVNNVFFDANTGGNSASKNTGGDSTIKTGDVNVMLNIVNFVNNNFAGGKVLVTVVNVFGSWLGDLKLPGAEEDAVDEEKTADNIDSEDNKNDSPAIGGYSPSTGNSDTGSSSGNAGDTDSQQSTIVLASNQTMAPRVLSSRYFVSEEPEGKLASGVFAENEVKAAEDASTAGSQNVRVNLAWLLPIGAFAFTITAIRRREALLALLSRFRKS